MERIRGLEIASLELWQLRVAQAVHIELARSNFAMHITLLGISRWVNGGVLVASQLGDAISPSPRIAWLDTANLNFQAWLTAGGFAQPELEAPAPLPAEITLKQAEDGNRGAGIDTGRPRESPKMAISISASSRHRMKRYVEKARVGNVPSSISPPTDIPRLGGLAGT